MTDLCISTASLPCSQLECALVGTTPSFLAWNVHDCPSCYVSSVRPSELDFSSGPTRRLGLEPKASEDPPATYVGGETRPKRVIRMLADGASLLLLLQAGVESSPDETRCEERESRCRWLLGFPSQSPEKEA